MNNIHIPEQLDQLSKKDLLEFAKTAHEENVKQARQLKKERDALRILGDSQTELARRLGATSNMFNDAVATCEELEQRLAKANERLNNPKGLQEFVCLEQMKEIPLLEIHRANQKLHEELAKANERIAELEGTILTLQNDLLRQSVFMINTAAKLEQHREWQATANVLRRPAREAKEALNKFAIEQNIEALETLKLKAVESVHKNWIVNPMNGAESPGVEELIKQSVGLNTAMIDSEIEQLRKEQENV